MSRILCQEVVMLMLYLISEITVRFRREKSCFIGGGLIAPSCHHPLFFFFFKSTLGIDEPLHIKRRKVIKPGFIHSPWKSAYIRQHRIDTNWRRGELKSPKVSCWAVCRVPWTKQDPLGLFFFLQTSQTSHAQEAVRRDRKAVICMLAYHVFTLISEHHISKSECLCSKTLSLLF